MGKKKGKKKPSQGASLQESESARSEDVKPPSQVTEKTKETVEPKEPQRDAAVAQAKPKPELLPQEERGPPVTFAEPPRAPPAAGGDIGKGRGRGRGRGKQPQPPASTPIDEPQGLGRMPHAKMRTDPQRQQPPPAATVGISFGAEPLSPVEEIQRRSGLTPSKEVAPTPVVQGARPRPIHGPQPVPMQGVAPHAAVIQPQKLEGVRPRPTQEQHVAVSQQMPKTITVSQPHQQPQQTQMPIQQPAHAPKPATPLAPPQTPRQPVQQRASPQKTKTEPLSMKSVAKQLPAATPDLVPPRRINYGTKGTPIRLRANHLAVQFDKNVVIHHYDVEILPELPKNMKGLKREIIETTMKTFAKQFPRRCVFDGEKNLYCVIRLPFPNDVETFEMQMPPRRPTDRPRTFTVTLKIAAYIRLSDLQNFLDGQIGTPPQNAIQALDIVLRHLPSMKYISLGRSIFPEERGPYLGEGVEMWTGYYQSLRPMWKALHLNLDVAHRTFFRSQSVLDYACEIFNVRQHSDLLTIHPRDWEIIATELKGLKIEVNHTQKRSYRIIGLSKKSAELQTFPLQVENGTPMQCTVAKYFLDTYKKPLQYKGLPCLQAQPADKHRYLPMEYCVIPVGQQVKKLKDFQTADMIKRTAKPAPEREQKIKELIKTTQFDLDPYAKDFGLRVSELLTQLPGRILPPPGITLKDRNQNKEVEPRRGVWDMRQHQFFAGVDVKTWGIFVYCRLYNDKLQYFITELMKVGRQVGSTFAAPIFSEFMKEDINVIESNFMTAKHEFPELQLIICILSGKTPLYAEVKRVADTRVGIRTQCIQVKNVMKSSPATLTNIMMKINAKMDGTNSVLGVAKSPVFKRPIIIFGADVTHPSAGDKSKPSIAAVVASMDQNAQKYRAKVLVQEHRVEIIKNLKEVVKQLLIEFRATLRVEPEKIIFYRDGVGEGQFHEVLVHELMAIRGACSSLRIDYKPAITFLVVQKRHHTRLFCENPRDADGRAQNVPPGTTVDQIITHPTENDFYLCSHQGIQGTSRPTHYHVLWDDSSFSADDLQLLTYQLCHTYVRCTRSVSIPAPAYYAHLVAFRARYHLEKLQRNLERENADPESYIERMQAAVEAHEKLGKMYFV